MINGFVLIFVTNDIFRYANIEGGNDESDFVRVLNKKRRKKQIRFRPNLGFDLLKGHFGH